MGTSRANHVPMATTEAPSSAPPPPPLSLGSLSEYLMHRQGRPRPPFSCVEAAVVASEVGAAAEGLGAMGTAVGLLTGVRALVLE